MDTYIRIYIDIDHMCIHIYIYTYLYPASVTSSQCDSYGWPVDMMMATLMTTMTSM